MFPGGVGVALHSSAELSFYKTKMRKKDCMFQYATNPGWGRGEIIKDTGLITRNEADELFEKYKADFINRLEAGERPEMVIWIGCKDESDYHTTSIHLDEDTKWDGLDFYTEEKEDID